MAKYDPLRRFLRRNGNAEIGLSFAEIERMIGAMLPKSAERPQWWANESDPSSRHVQARAWLEAGYEAFPDAGSEKVTFRRRIARG
jgi:hypothetical protein